MSKISKSLKSFAELPVVQETVQKTEPVAKNFAKIITGKRGRPAYDDKTWAEIMDGLFNQPRVRYVFEEASPETIRQNNWQAISDSHTAWTDKQAMNKVVNDPLRGLYNTARRQGLTRTPSVNIDMLEFPDFVYRPQKTPETNLKRFTEHVLEQYPDINSRDIEKRFNVLFSTFFGSGGTINYLSIFK